MNALLTKALEGLDLQTGQTYRMTVNGHEVELRVLDDTPTPELADQVMLLPWVEFPYPNSGATVIARPGPLELSPPPDLPMDEEEP